MNTELMYLVAVTAFTGLMWVPYILDRIAVWGLADTVGYPETPKPQSPWARRMKSAHANAVENLVVFAALDWIEDLLSRQRFLAGARLTEADWRLFTTLLRFDAVYYGHFKCNLRRIADYRNLSNYLRDLYQVPGIADTVNMDHIKRHYYMSMTAINPTRIVPLGPALDFSAAHDRGRFEQAPRPLERVDA